MKKSTVNDVISDYLDNLGFKKSETKEVINNFKNGIKKVKADKKAKEKAAKEKDEVDHGTTCLGIIHKKEGKAIRRKVEW